jgi:SAM-dependent methyltransferase
VNAPRKVATVEDFEAMYQENADPWGFLDSWYERRKYAITVASLPRERYRLVWEPACSIGVLTGLLALRADRVLASDVSRTALATARRSVLPPGAGQVDWSVLRLPQRPPAEPGSVDLVVLSEILYYLSEPNRLAVLAAAHEVLAPDGELVVAHWRPLPDDAQLSGDDANAWVRALPGWSLLVRHDDEQFVLDVLRRC